MRNSMSTGIFDASDNLNPCSTMSTMRPRSGRGSSRHMVDLSAKAWVRS